MFQFDKKNKTLTPNENVMNEYMYSVQKIMVNIVHPIKL